MTPEVTMRGKMRMGWFRNGALSRLRRPDAEHVGVERWTQQSDTDVPGAVDGARPGLTASALRRQIAAAGVASGGFSDALSFRRQ